VTDTRDTEIDKQLKRELGRQLCDMVNGFTQVEAAVYLRLPQSAISMLRRGLVPNGLSMSRLFRVIAAQGYNVEVHFKFIHGRFAPPRKIPTLTVVRYDRFGRQVVLDSQPA
jgi:hypothetical protein